MPARLEGRVALEPALHEVVKDSCIEMSTQPVALHAGNDDVVWFSGAAVHSSDVVVLGHVVAWNGDTISRTLPYHGVFAVGAAMVLRAGEGQNSGHDEVPVRCEEPKVLFNQ